MNRRAPLPWTFSEESGDWYVRDATGAAIMANPDYYPWCPDSKDDWEMIVRAVNAQPQKAGKDGPL